MSNDPKSWNDACSAVADAMETECASEEGRKNFYSTDGVSRAQREIRALSALQQRFAKFVRA